MNYPHDTVPEIANRKFVYQTQHRPDHVKLELLCPKDQSLLYRAQWSADGSALEFIQVTEADLKGDPETAEDKALAAEVVRLTAMKRGDLKTLAAERSVDWDKTASNETMVALIATAKFAKPVTEPAPVDANQASA